MIIECGWRLMVAFMEESVYYLYMHVHMMCFPNRVALPTRMSRLHNRNNTTAEKWLWKNICIYKYLCKCANMTGSMLQLLWLLPLVCFGFSNEPVVMNVISALVSKNVELMFRVLCVATDRKLGSIPKCTEPLANSRQHVYILIYNDAFRWVHARTKSVTYGGGS